MIIAGPRSEDKHSCSGRTCRPPASTDPLALSTHAPQAAPPTPGNIKQRRNALSARRCRSHISGEPGMSHQNVQPTPSGFNQLHRLLLLAANLTMLSHPPARLRRSRSEGQTAGFWSYLVLTERYQRLKRWIKGKCESERCEQISRVGLQPPKHVFFRPPLKKKMPVQIQPPCCQEMASERAPSKAVVTWKG